MFVTVNDDNRFLAFFDNPLKLRDLYPVEIGFEKCSPDKYNPKYRTREHYLIHYVFSGRGYFANKNAHYEVKKGECFIVRPGESNSWYQDSSDPWNYIWIGFYGKVASGFDIVPDVFPFDDEPFHRLRDIQKKQSATDINLVAFLYELCEKMFLLYPKPLQDMRDVNVRSALNFIEHGYMNDIKIDSIAQALHLNRSYLSRIFTLSVGMNMRDYLVKTRLDKAHELLSDGYRASDVYQMVGYSELSVFSRAFKKHFGCSPAEVKNKNKYRED